MTYSVAVRELCEFAAKTGDLDLRFTPAPTALEGMEGHARVAQRRGFGYETELSLQGLHEELLVRGRADGWDAARGRLEEIKTHKGKLERQPATHRALHWAQLRIYGHLLCELKQLDQVELALVYLNITSEQETVFTERCSAADLREFFARHCDAFLAWARQQLAHRKARDAALQQLKFPHGEFRAGQRVLATAVYNAARSGRPLLAQAPTGIGKTLGTLFPLFKAAPGQRLDKVFFLSAKTSGRQLALDAVQQLDKPSVRVLELVARDKVCEHPDKACHGESCPLAQGFYDKLPAARAAACSQSEPLDQARVREIARRHEVCPYYLSQELVRWSDLVVGDYNYFFDGSALLHSLAQVNDWRVALLVDEAHNLVDRGRSMYSAELRPDSLADARGSATARQQGTIKRALDKLRKTWHALASEIAEASDGYRVCTEPPPAWLEALVNASGTISEHLAEHPADAPDPALQGFYLEALQFLRLCETLEPSHSLIDLSRNDSPSPLARGKDAAWRAETPVVCLRNIVPAPHLKPRLESAHTVTLFSATLQPPACYADLLGLPEQHAWVDVESPFRAEQLRVEVAREVSTRWRDRAGSLDRIAERIAGEYARRPGNYLAFFSSYDYLQQAADRLAARHPDLPQWRQQRRMGEAEQKAFLERFTEVSRGIAFAVLGGAFAEGVDLPGDRLIGAFVATLGLPQVNPVMEQFRERLDARFGAGRGYDYAYLVPGLQKVVQAAGRVIRTTEDQGVVVLLDDRFARREVRALLPRWWALG
ncbi:helicase C-terminal domain-containing protein [Pelomonas sp. SE-A7]|uniref:helicase C-terminal domain-containing protein n=1 Tax=Pelomonas sp. SE-A7 TaxID=3054953 RepID=UPI00259C7E82|nr:helicase C-terminal domain-containing protein [Pelomonas sp. SE-A7]MDM4766588.1 helicase C-terminal domain-containing protein [Pelomonas sp. SE-A7]